MVNINNKTKQFYGGNWGSNKFTKKNTNIPKDFAEDSPTKHKSLKRKKKKPKGVPLYYACPFCEKELEEDKDEYAKQKKEKLYTVLRWCRKPKCECGAYRVSDCPSCHGSTWYKEGVYKHQGLGCGFEGKRK